MDMENVLQVGSVPIGKHGDKKYMDSDIVFLDNVRDLPLVDGSLRVDRFVSVTCYMGKLQLDINATAHTIHANQILICHPNDMIANTMLSPDFEGTVLCFSHKIIMEMFGESNMWDCVFYLTENPVIHARRESLKILRTYNEAFRIKVKMGQTAFHKEIVCSIVKAVFYELMENIDNHAFSNVRGVRHSEILFKQFMELLSGCTVKPRNVSWYARQLCVTPKHLSTVCRQVSGKTAFYWINEYVIIDIRHLLKNSDKPIKEVVDLLRFPNVSFFGSYCRKHFGMAPTEYRKYLRTSTSNKNNTGHYGKTDNKQGKDEA